MAVTKELKDAIKKMQNGDETGFAVFYEQTYSYVYEKAKYVMHEEEDALDLTQETYIQAYRGIGSIEDVNNVYAWLGGIVYRQGMRIFNKKKEVLAGEEQDYLFEEIESNEVIPEQAVEQQATVNIVQGMIDELPELQRVAIMAFYFDNMKIDEIAGMCECSANTIKSRLNYAKKYLKDKVEAHEKQNRYKLCSISPAIILLAFEGLLTEENYRMPAQAIRDIYTASCNSLGIKAAGTIAVGGNASSSTGAAAGGSASGSAGAVAGAAATAKAGLGIKIGIAVVALLATGGITAAVVHNQNSTPEEPVAVVEEQEENDQQAFTELQTEEMPTEATPTEATEEMPTEESLHDESIPMEGLYQYGIYSMSITNATVEDYLNATFDMELIYTNPDTGEVETVTVTSVRKENGVATIDATSSLGNRWFGNLKFMYDNSIRLDLSEQDTSGGVWDIVWEGSVVILTKAGAQGVLQDRMPEEGIYGYMNGTDDNSYSLSISDVDGNSFRMNFEIVSAGGHKIDSLQTDTEWVYMNNGIATFTGPTSWNVGLQGYLYVNEDGSISLSYTATDGAEEVPWYGAYPDGCFEPIILQRN